MRCKLSVIQKNTQLVQYLHGKAEPTCSVTLAVLPEPGVWAKYAPRVELTIDNAETYDAFVLGAVYFVDFNVAQV